MTSVMPRRNPLPPTGTPITIAALPKQGDLDKAWDVMVNSLINDHPFFASMLLRTPRSFSTRVPTAGVDAKARLYINPSFFIGLSNRERVFLMAHEIMHIIGNHALRKSMRDHRMWNWATDAWINETLVDSKVGKFIECGIRLDGAHLLTPEEIYKDMEQQQSQPPEEPTDPGDEPTEPGEDDGDDGNDIGDQPGNTPTDSGDDGNNGDDGTPTDGRKPSDVEVTDKNGNKQPMRGDGYGDEWVDCDDGEPTPDEQREVETEVTIAVLSAAKAAASRGKLPAALQKVVAKLVESDIPWHEKLHDFFKQRTTTDISWRRRNRRFDEVYLPSRSAGMIAGEVVINHDVSGSICQAEFDEYVGHTMRIIADCRPKRLHVLYTDTSVVRHDTYEFDDMGDLELHYVRGGGTWMESAFKYLEQHDIDPEFVITLTDGYDSYNKDNEPTYPVVWLLTTDAAEPPYGTTIRAKLGKK